VTLVNDYYLVLLLAIPIFAALGFGLMSDADGGKGLHRMATIVSVGLFGFSLGPWLVGQTSVPSLVAPWIPSLGISFALGADSLSQTLVVLTTFLLMMAVVASYTNITKRLRLYYSMLFTLIAAVIGVFIARDAFTFFLMWELELIPMFLLIAIWGGPRRDYAAMKFVLYTLFGSVFLVAGILALYFHARSIGADPNTLFLFSTLKAAVANGLPLGTQVLILSALLLTFAIKLPVVPFHTWLPDAHVEAPTPVSMLLAGILLKMGAYGMLQIGFGWLPEAAKVVAPYLGLLAVINIVYTAGVALVQSDLKKLIAYSSVSHMGFVLLGLAALNATGFMGAVFVMVSHGVVSAALFMCVGTLYVRTHTRDLAAYGGFGQRVPTLFYFFLFMSMASLGLPLLISFAGESLVFYGAFISHAFQQIDLGAVILPWSIQTLTVVSGLGVIIGAAYLLWMLKRVFYGEQAPKLATEWATITDARPSELFVLGSLAVLVLYYGFAPSALTRQYESAVYGLTMPYLVTHPLAAKPAPGCHCHKSAMAQPVPTLTKPSVPKIKG
jgi:NADH-quinone oxidoreductase subunit M